MSRILDAASELFVELGFEGTSTAEIARRAKVSKRELYIHFADKRAILSAAIESLEESIGSQMEVEWSATGEIRSTLLQAGMAIHDFVSSKRFRRVFRIVAAAAFEDRPARKQSSLLGRGAVRQQAAKFLAVQMKAGRLRKADPVEAADDFLDMVITARRMAAMAMGRAERTMKPKRHVEHAVEVFLAYYGRGGGGLAGAAAKRRRDAR